MIKLELSDTIKEIHKEYFKKKINFQQYIDIDIEEESLDNLNNILNSSYKEEDIKSLHIEFFNYCKEKSDILSVGDVKELNLIIKEIKEDYLVIKKMIDEDIKCSIAEEKNYKTYKDVLYDIFGYEDFSKKKFHNIKREKDITSDKKLNLKGAIKTNKYNLSENTVDELLRIIYDKWKVNSTYILKKINENEFLDFWGAYLFVYLIDIRVCPYCNRQYITPVFEQDGSMRGDLDHFLPKSKYPYLSMSIYNLIPVCKFCNSSFKGKEEFKKGDLNPYEDSFDDYVKFCFDMDLENNIDIKIKKYDDNNSNVDKYIKMFKLNDQYQYHTNKVEELIYKRLMYSEEYINNIRDNFFGSSISTEQLKETIIGYTSEKSKINDEPLSKLKRDIVSQLKFFENPDEELVKELEKILQDKI